MTRVTGRLYWLWCCFGVLLVGCGSTQPTTKTPLLPFVIPTLTPTAILRLIHTPTLIPVSTVLKLAPTPLPLKLSTPKCYETSVGSLWCLGLITNNQNTPVHQVIVRVNLVTVDGDSLAERQVQVASLLLMPGDSSPYGTLFESVPERMVGAVATLDRTIEGNDGLIPLPIQDVTSQVNESVWTITGKAIIPANTNIEQAALIATLFDEENHITGFKQVPLNSPLSANSTVPFAFDLVPQGSRSTRVEVRAESRH
jgi:hypothetical protein